ncbi:hypothetical protein SAMN05421693_102134 [Ectothiorhodospira magna]|uniref:Uncharacterized protein n=1 Tax=Ectothiorhodospira magna TaxID=867345 RepID=A0A1H8ZG34_9GAMM|nr:hypothetical protein [Ectothiorhodospira magna]SEP63336.1 hypothetical protein SAMN05421693_102134 [Ectothiorhodospira magna]
MSVLLLNRIVIRVNVVDSPSGVHVPHQELAISRADGLDLPVHPVDVPVLRECPLQFTLSCDFDTPFRGHHFEQMGL